MNLRFIDPVTGAEIKSPATTDQPVTLQVNVYAADSSKEVTGVAIVEDTSNLKSGTVTVTIAKGIGRSKLSTLAPGQHEFAARFVGTDEFFGERTSTHNALTVNAASLAAPTGAALVTVMPQWLDPHSGSPVGDSITVDQCELVRATVGVSQVAGNNVSGTVALTSETPSPGYTASVTITGGKGTATLNALPPGSYTFTSSFNETTAYHSSPGAPATLKLTVRKALTPISACIYRMPPLLSTLVGVNVEGASSTSPGARFFGNVAADIPGHPLGAERLTNIEKAKVLYTGALRIAAMAQPGTLSSSALTQGYFATAVNATPDKIVQSWEGTAAVSFVIHSTNLGFGTFDNGTPTSKDFPRNTLLTTSVVFGGGFISPLSASQSSPTVYYATSQIQQAYPLVPWGTLGTACTYTPPANPPCFFAFIPTDRLRFYRHYEAGFRVRIYGEDFDHNVLRFPGMMDVTVGQNEYVTSGGFNGVVLHLGGFVPIPIPKVDGIYAFGALDASLNGPVGTGQQLLLNPAPSTANVTYLSTTVYDIPVSQPNRDRYRFGFGIDIFHLLTAKQQKQGTSAASSTSSN